MADGSAIRPELAHLNVFAFDTRDAWLAARSAVDSLGASECAMALGVSPWGTPWSFWESKRHPSKDKRTAQTQRGNRWESAVLADYEDASGHQVFVPDVAVNARPRSLITLSNPRIPWLRESPDGFAIDRVGHFGHVEAKTALQAGAWAPEQGMVIERWDDSCAEVIPPHYAVQAYVQLIVTDLPWNDLCALVPTRGWPTIRYVRLLRDTETQAALEEALTEWRERHLVRGEPPELDGSEPCNRYLARKYPSLAGKEKPARNATDDELRAMVELYDLRQQAKAADERADLLRNQLLASAAGLRLLAGPHKKAPYGQPQNSMGRVTVDVDGLRREAPELVARHERQGNPFASFNLYRFEQVRALVGASQKETEEHERVG